MQRVRKESLRQERIIEGVKEGCSITWKARLLPVLSFSATACPADFLVVCWYVKGGIFLK